MLAVVRRSIRRRLSLGPSAVYARGRAVRSGAHGSTMGAESPGRGGRVGRSDVTIESALAAVKVAAKRRPQAGSGLDRGYTPGSSAYIDGAAATPSRRTFGM